MHVKWSLNGTVVNFICNTLNCIPFICSDGQEMKMYLHKHCFLLFLRLILTQLSYSWNRIYND